MIAALATLAFLVAGWTALYALIVDADDHGSKVLAALKGQSFAAREPVTMRPVTVRFSLRDRVIRLQPTRAQAEWRAAA